MSAAKYSFDGQYSRKPEQSYGKGTKELTRDLLVERAQQERHRREEERLRAHSVVVIQAAVRSFLTRAQLKNVYRERYYAAAQVEAVQSLEEQRTQLFRLIRFFDDSNPRDGLIYSNHVNQLLEFKTQLLELCYTEAIWALIIRNFVRIGFMWYTAGNDVQRRTTRRSAIKFLHVLSENVGNHDESLRFFSALWMDLTLSYKFFDKWYYCCEFSFKYYQPPTTPALIPDSMTDLLNILILPFKLISNFKDTSPSWVIRSGLYCGNGKWCSYGKSVDITVDLVQRTIFEKFTETFLEHCIECLGENVSGQYVLSELSPEFPSGQFADYVHNFYDIYVHRGTSEIRNLLQASLILHSPKKRFEEGFYHKTLLFILCLINAVDDRYVSSVERRYLSADFNMYDTELPPKIHQYVTERSTVMAELKEYLLTLPTADLLSLAPLKTEAVTLIIATLVLQDHKKASIDFPFLNKLAYNRRFLRELYEAVILTQEEKTFNDVVSLSFLFTQLAYTLHDGEFLSGIPINKDELSLLINCFVDCYGLAVASQHPGDRDEYKITAMVISQSLICLHDRNMRLQIFPEEIFLSSDLQRACPIENHYLVFQTFIDGSSDRKMLPNDDLLYQILRQYPFALSFHDRVRIMQRMILIENQDHLVPYRDRKVIQIRRALLYEDTFEKLSIENVSDMRDPVRITLVNTVGLLEAGVDGGGLLREFLTEATKAGLDPNRGLFRLDSQNRVYPNSIAKKIIDDYELHYFMIGRLIGKSLYEQTLLDLPFAPFFIQKCLSSQINSAADFLATVDPALHKHLLSLKTFTGDFSSLGLDFTLTLNEVGETRTVDLKENGSFLSVDSTNVIEYIHLVADYKINRFDHHQGGASILKNLLFNREVIDECKFFRDGLCSVVPVISMFSWRELQTLISGSEKPIDIDDWKRHTNYSSGYNGDHPCIKMFWKVVESLEEQQLQKLLKFVTSCSRPPLLGFKDLVPNFGIQNVGHVVRLPTAATCMNLLKLPEFDDAETLQEKLIYAIEAQAGFELS